MNEERLRRLSSLAETYAKNEQLDNGRWEDKEMRTQLLRIVAGSTPAETTFFVQQFGSWWKGDKHSLVMALTVLTNRLSEIRMPQSYWDSLEWVKTAASILQKYPVPETDEGCELLQSNLKAAKIYLGWMLDQVTPLLPPRPQDEADWEYLKENR